MRKIGLMALALLGGLSLCVIADEKVAVPAAAGGPVAMDEKAMMEQMMKLGQPSEKHALLGKMAGKFKAETKMWEPGKAEPTVSQGESVNTLVFDGRYLKQDFTGTFMGQPYTGVGYAGYDNVIGKYQSTWLDSMSTSMMMTEGDAEGNVITLTGEVSCPMTRAKMKCREVVTVISDTQHKFEMYCPDPATGKEMKGMEIVYTKE